MTTLNAINQTVASAISSLASGTPPVLTSKTYVDGQVSAVSNNMTASINALTTQFASLSSTDASNFAANAQALAQLLADDASAMAQLATLVSNYNVLYASLDSVILVVNSLNTSVEGLQATITANQNAVV